MPFIFSVDIGGTFTDLVACDLDSGALSFSKSPTTYDDLGRGVFDCIRRASVDARDAIFVKHGTTLVINALLQRSGAVTALVTTRGFADVLEIARGNRMRPFDLRFRRDEPLIPHELRFEVSERMLASGQVDIVVGTHSLLSKAIQFKDLGLLIVDEEQHFGVGHKERLKSLRDSVHVLTLTATPIPRTLQLALTGVRDLSLLATPPVDRLAIRTFISPFDPLSIREALLREKYRGGQAFYVVPRI